MPSGTLPVQADTMASGTCAAISDRTAGSVSTVTNPAPQRRAPRAASTAAPPIPSQPARMATCPKSRLCVSHFKGKGRPGRSTKQKRGVGTWGMGSATTVISPQNSAAGLSP